MNLIKNAIIAGSIGSLAALTGCSTTSTISNENKGMGIGALLGAASCAISNANTTECALLIVGGAFAGYSVAKYIDEKDKTAYTQAASAVLSEGHREFTVTSKDTGETITMAKQPDGLFKNKEGQECNRLTVTYKETDHQETYCKSSDGSWTLI